MGKAKLVKEFSEKDATEARESLLLIARDPSTKPKDKVEAWKLLMRIHKRLQVDKQVVKESARTEKPKLKPSHKKDLDEIQGLNNG